MSFPLSNLSCWISWFTGWIGVYFDVSSGSFVGFPFVHFLASRIYLTIDAKASAVNILLILEYVVFKILP